MKSKKMTTATLSLMMLCGMLNSNISLLDDTAVIVDAEDECYTFNSTTGQLTLQGNVVLNEIHLITKLNSVKSIWATKGTILPEDCYHLFYYCDDCTEIDIHNADTSNVTNMAEMFAGCSSLVSLDISNFDTSNVTNMAEMFAGCSSLVSLDVSNFDTSSVTNMTQMFSNCRSLASLDVGNFDTSNVTNMARMFTGCNSLAELDLRSFNT